MTNKVERIEHLLKVAAVHRDQLEAMASEFCELHNTKPGSEDHEDLLSVILDGEDYKGVMLDIRKRRANKWRGKKK
jgi:hypothetical protein